MQLAKTSNDASETTTRGHRRWLSVAVAFGAFPAFLLSLGVVASAALRDSELVTTRAGLRSVDLGWPLVWIHQDQRSMDPPLPYRMGLVSPWEDPVDVSGTAFLLNVLIVFAVVSIGGLLVSALAIAAARRITPPSNHTGRGI